MLSAKTSAGVEFLANFLRSENIKDFRDFTVFPHIVPIGLLAQLSYKIIPKTVNAMFHVLETTYI